MLYYYSIEETCTSYISISVGFNYHSEELLVEDKVTLHTIEGYLDFKVQWTNTDCANTDQSRMYIIILCSVLPKSRVKPHWEGGA